MSCNNTNNCTNSTICNTTTLYTKFDELNYISGILGFALWIAQIVVVLRNRSTKDVSLISQTINLICIILYFVWACVNEILSGYSTAGITVVCSFVLFCMKVIGDIILPIKRGEKIKHYL